MIPPRVHRFASAIWSLPAPDSSGNARRSPWEPVMTLNEIVDQSFALSNGLLAVTHM